MDDNWIPESVLKEKYPRKISTVSFDEVYLAPVSGDAHSFAAFGGQFPLNPQELQEKVIDAYLRRFKKFKGLAIRFCRAVNEPLVLTDESGTDIPFDYVIGLIHTYGQSYSDEHDIGTLTLIQKEAQKEAAPELEQARYAFFLPLGSPGVAPALEPSKYNSCIVGRLGKIPDGEISFIREVLPAPA